MRLPQTETAARLGTEAAAKKEHGEALGKHDTTTDAAATYIEAGLALVPIPKGGKRPTATGWNTRERVITTQDQAARLNGGGIGLAHLFSRTCAIDVDDFQNAESWLAERGIDLTALLCAEGAVQIKSGRPNRAKLLYRLPEAVDWLPTYKAAPYQTDNGETAQALELRCAKADGSATVQDVLPPSIHPDTGKPYEWHGDWRNLPELPESLLSLWLTIAGEHAGTATTPQSSQSGIIGQFNAAHDPGEILERNGYRPAGNRWLSPDSTSKTPGVVRLPDSDPPRVYSHHGDALATGHSHDAFSLYTMLEHGGDASAACKAASRVSCDGPAPEPSEAKINPDDLLPGFPDELLTLPHGLGDLQDWIHGRMKYPSRATSGIAAFATLTAFAQSHITVDSFGGVGLNEQYMVLAPTGFGKEDLRSPVTVLADEIGAGQRLNLSRVQWSAPSSLQGLHGLLEDHPAQFFLSDEFAEWIVQTARDQHKQAALGYLMQLYTKALSTVNAPAAITQKYEPVRRPRVSVLATSTAERILESMTLSHADSGAYNRWVIFIAEQCRIDKRYTGLVFRPPQDVVDLVGTVAAYPETEMTFTADAWQYFIERDSTVIEPLKFDDNHLAGRLSEQALKLAALVALSAYRTEITADDMRVAYAIREGLYHRVRALANHDGAMSGMHTTGQALEQVREILRRRESVYKSRLPSLSRKYKGLSVQERHAVLAALYESGEIADAKERRGVIVSQVQP